MKQILQSFKTGETKLEEVPAPIVKQGQVLIQTTRSLVSLGTERMLVEFGKASLIKKARQQPDKVKMVLDKVQSDGLKPTLKAVFNKLEQPLPLGYCNVGKVIEVGVGVSDFRIGDRVSSNGPHAEFVSVPQNLVAHIPDSVSDEEATFTVIGSIGLQGIRLISPTIGETIVVIGLGLIGLLTAEMLIANGCRVIGYDLDDEKVKIANEKGIFAFNPNKGNDPVKSVMSFTNNIGADGVIITASSKGDDIISRAAQMSRKRGRIVLVGVINLNISRSDFYEKELSFQVSCSYGPGRYDDNYEQKGIDYPLQFVRWTEKRNFEAVLEAIATNRLNVKPLITEVIALNNYLKIYGDIGKSKSIASILKYNENSEANTIVTLSQNKIEKTNGIIGIIGAGNYTGVTLLPILKSVNANIKYIASLDGLDAKILAKKFNIANATSDYKEILNDKEVNSVIITTRHDSHSNLVIEALEAGKHVFVEKPLALNEKQLSEVIEVYKKTENQTLTIGYNRRFAPFTKKIKERIGNNLMQIIATMNAGPLPANVWVHDMVIGGGRIIGEACHFIDLCIYLTGSKVKAVVMNSLGQNPADNTDNASIMLKFENGSTAVINYFANGAKSYAKERVEVFSQEKIMIIDNWRRLSGYGIKGFKTIKSRMDKGHTDQFRILVNSLKEGGSALIPFEEIVNSSKASLAAITSLKTKNWTHIE